MSASVSSNTSAWSPAVSGLRGRLIAEPASVVINGHFLVDIELENVGTAPLEVQGANAQVCLLSVRNAAGAAVPPTFQRGEVLTLTAVDVLPPLMARRFRISILADDGAADAQLDVTTSAWKLPAGQYQLSGRYSSARFSAASPSAWQGELEIPAVKVVVTP
jgi:hypothetical protein